MKSAIGDFAQILYEDDYQFKDLNQNSISLGKDLAFSPLSFGLGYIGGGVNSFFDPTTLRKVVNAIRNKEIDSFQEFTGFIGTFTGYFSGLYLIYKEISEHPENPANYLPLALNAAFMVGKTAYKYGKKKRLEEIVS